MGQRPREVGRQNWAPGLPWDWNGRITQHVHKYTVREATQGNRAAKTSTLYLFSWSSFQTPALSLLVPRYCCDKPHTSQFFFLSLSGTVGSCHLFSFQISAPLKGVPVSLNAAAGENGLQVRLWISLVSLDRAWCVVILSKLMDVKYVRCNSQGWMWFLIDFWTQAGL